MDSLRVINQTGLSGLMLPVVPHFREPFRLTDTSSKFCHLIVASLNIYSDFAKKIEPLYISQEIKVRRNDMVQPDLYTIYPT